MTAKGLPDYVISVVISEDTMAFETAHEEALYGTLKQMLQNHVSTHGLSYYQTLAACIPVLGYVLYVMIETWEDAPPLIRAHPIDRLDTSLAGHRRRPGVDRVLTDPQGDVTAIVQGLIILAPVVDALSHLVLGMSMGAFMGLRQVPHRWLSGLLISKPDARFSGCQVLLRHLHRM